MNKKGQALVEFVLILPIFLFLVFAVYDFGMIYNLKNKLENDSVDIVLLYRNGDSVDDIRVKYNNVNIQVIDDGNYYKFDISDNIKLITPGFNLIFGNPYYVHVERYVPHE